MNTSAQAAVKLTAEMARFNAALFRYLEVFEKNMETVVKQVALKYVAMVQERTPVDTGRARASIHAEFLGSGPFTYTVPGTRARQPRGSARQGRRRGIRATRPARMSFDGTIGAPDTLLKAHVGSNVEYILPLEAGHSRQAPAGMFRIAAIGLRELMRSAIKAELDRQRQSRPRG